MTKNKLKSSEIKKLIKVFEKLGTLKQVERTGWILKGVNNPESIADHNFRVTIIAMILCEKFPQLDKTKVLELSLIHDWGVIKLGDIISEHGKKVVGDKKSKHEDERVVVKELVKNVPEKGKRFLKLWDEYNDQKTKEALFLKQVEKLEMALQALEYEASRRNSSTLDEFWENAEKYLEGKELEPFLKELKKLRESI